MKKAYDEIILDHYKLVADVNGDKSTCSMEDQYIRNTEVEFIKREIKRYIEWKNDTPTIFEIGCGNGYLLSVLKKEFPTAKISAIEFTPELYKVACDRHLEGVDIKLGDCRKIDDYVKDVDIVISERVLINLLDIVDQRTAIENISASLKQDGIYIMVESFIEPFKEINIARHEVLLPKLEMSHQNLYLPERMAYRMQYMGFREIEGTMPKNYLSSHFFLTRVFHWLVRPNGGRKKSDRLVEFFDHAVPPAILNYSPILLRVFKKV